jgi:hypothetical protein
MIETAEESTENEMIFFVIMTQSLSLYDDCMMDHRRCLHHGERG